MHIFVVLLAISVAFVCAHEKDKTDIIHAIWADPSKSYRLGWKVNHQKGTVTFEVGAKTNGWIGLGILQDRTRRLKYADLWIGWVDKTGKVHIEDCHGDSNGHAMSDKHNDLRLVSYKKGKRLNVLRFQRDLATNDKEDFDIMEGLRTFVFAWSANKPDAKYPCKSFHKRNANLRFRNLQILRIQKEIPPLLSDMKYFDLIHIKVKVPARRTTYWCTKFKLSDFADLKSPNHIVAFEPRIQKREINIIHHMVLHSCYAKRNEKNSIFSKPCFREDMPASVHDCGMLGGIYAWGIGAPTFRFPENVGYPIITNDTSHYYLLQVHFNNELLRKDIVDTSGLRFYYTTPRKYEAGMITVGASISDDMIIPPGMKKWTVKGVCTKGCIKKMRPRKRIKLFASMPHGHSTTIGIRTTVVRKGVEVDEVIHVDSFDMNHQHFYSLNKQIEVREGDELFTYCTYRTLGKKYAITGGMGSNREMCLNFIMYYPKIDVETCLSNEIVAQPAFTAKYARPVFTDCNKGDIPEEDTNHWRFSNWTGVEWTKSMKEELYTFYNRNNPRPMVQPVCRGRSGVKYDLPPIYRPIVKKKLRRDEIIHSLHKKEVFFKDAEKT